MVVAVIVGVGLALRGAATRVRLLPQDWFDRGSAIMTPSVVVALLVLSCSLLLWLLRGERFWARCTSHLLAAVTILWCVALGLRMPHTTVPLWDLTPVLPFATHMSSATSTLLILLASDLAMLSTVAFSRRPWRAIGFAVAILLLGMCVVSILGQSAGVPLLLGDSRVHVAPYTAAAIGCLSLALAFGFGLRPRLHRLLLDINPLAAGLDDSRERQMRLNVDLVVFAGVVLLGLTSYFFLSYHREQRREEIANELIGVADLKVAQINAWRLERLSDIHAFTQTPFLASALARGLDASDRSRFIPYFENVVSSHGYRRLVLLDAQLAPRLVLPAGSTAPSIPPDVVQALPQSRSALLGKLVRNNQNEPRLDLFAPILQPGSDAFAGVIQVRLDVRGQLFTSIQQWPGHTETGEILLFDSSADPVLLLNERRFTMDDESAVRRPTAQQADSISLRAVREHAYDLTEGLDYRNVPVFAVARPVAGLPWVLVAKVDRNEAYAPMISEVLNFSLVLGLIIITSGSLLGALWRRRQRELMRREQQAEHARVAAVERLALVTQHANDSIFLIDENMRIVEANERAVASYGYSMAEMLQLTARDLRGGDGDRAMEDFSRVITMGAHVFEAIHRRKDGAIFPVEISARTVQLEGRRHVLSLVRDITLRKAHENEIERLSGMYQVLTRISQTVAHSRTEADLFEQICRDLTDFRRFNVAWIGCVDPTTKLLVPRATAGDEYRYLEGIHISVEANTLEGRGPAGTAFREGRIYVANDFFADSATQPWRARAARSGIRSTIALPLRCDGVIVGVLTVYAAETGFFGPPEIALLNEAANEVSFALDVIARDARRQAAESALRESESRMQFLLTAGTAVIFSLRPTAPFDVTFMSQNVRQLLGFTPEDFQGDPNFWRGRVHPDDILVFDAELPSLYATGGLVREYRFRHNDGGYRWIHNEIRLVHDDQGAPLALVGYWSEVTERKRMEEALRDSEERYRFIADNTPDMIWIGDLSTGLFTYVSPSSLQQRGYAPEQMIGCPMRDFQPPETQEYLSNRISERIKALEAGDESARHRTDEIAFLRKDGSLIYTEVLSTLMSDEQGKFTRLLGITRDISERRRAEADLRKMSRALEQAPVSVVITDLTGRIEYVNPYFTHITGYDFDEVRGQNPRILKANLTTPETYAEMWRTLIDGRVWRGELHNRKKNGEIYVELAIIAPILDTSGKATHYVALKEDITERNRVQVALRQSEERFRAIFDHAEVGMFETTLDGRLIHANSFLAAMLDQPVEALTGRHWLEFTPGAPSQPEAPPPVIPQEMRFARADGRGFWGLIASKREADASGRPLGHLCILQDITAQVDARETLVRFNAKLESQVMLRTAELASRNQEVQALLHSIPDVVMRLRGDRTVLHYQRAHDSPGLIALDRERGSPDAAAAPATLVELSLPLGQRALRENRTLTAESELDIPGGTVAVELRVAPSGSEEFVVFVRDITERRRLEAEAAAMLERERQVSEMKSRFISVTSHEFRTPMAAAIGSVELLTNHFDRLSPAKRQELLTRTSGSLRRMTEMLDDLLTLNRMEAHRLTVQLTSLDLAGHLRSIIDEIRMGDRSAHSIELHVAGLAGPMTTDAGLLHHIFSNLLSNAVRYSPSGAPITVSVLADAQRVRITVEDRGIGVPAADLARIFEPFERGSNVGHIKGTGLGLNIVKRMTELLGGAVSVESLAESGTRFVVELPYHTVAPSAASHA